MTLRMVAAERASGCSRETVFEPTGSPVRMNESTIARRTSRSRPWRIGSVMGRSLSWHRGGSMSSRLPQAGEQKRADEGIEVAVEHAVDVPDLHTRAVVLDHPVGLQHVGADLAAEVDLHLLAFLRLPLLLLLAQGLLVETGAQDLHRHVAVPVLAALVLTLHDDAG